jgi:hypothetical protein
VRNELSKAFRDALIARVCDNEMSRPPHHGLYPVNCHRRAPLILQQPLSDEHGRGLGVFTLLADEEAADAVYAFATRNGLSAGFRAALLSNMCERDGVTCTRTRAKAMSQVVAKAAPGQGHYPEPLEIWEDEEPADAIYKFAKKHSIDVAMRQSLVFAICGNPESGFRCSRPIPAEFSMPIVDEKGEAKGILHVRSRASLSSALL